MGLSDKRLGSGIDRPDLRFAVSRFNQGPRSNERLTEARKIYLAMILYPHDEMRRRNNKGTFPPEAAQSINPTIAAPHSVANAAVQFSTSIHHWVLE